MAEHYYHENNNNFLVALLAIAVIAAIAFGIYWVSGSERNSTHITLPQNRVQIQTPEVPTPSLPTTPARE